VSAQKEKNQLHEMIMKEVQESVKNMFEQSHQHHFSEQFFYL
jgi:hypothetical protein